jgi:hypothetical protein
MKEGKAGAAWRLWLTLIPNGQFAGVDNVLWNGGFESDTLLGWGFDWQVQSVWGVEVTLDQSLAAKGRQSLRVTFNSFPSLDYAGVFQFVAVEPGREYVLRALAKALDFATRSGLKLQVVTANSERVLAETAAIAGTTADWMTLESRVRIPNDVSLIRVRLRREPAPGPEGNLGGKVWVDDVRLLPVREAGA